MSAAPSTSARTKPFLFERSFDDPSKVYLPGEKFGPKVKVDLPKPKANSGEQADGGASAAPAEPPPPPPKTFTEAELEAAREAGYVEGHTSALEEAETAREHYVADALNIISQSLDGLEEQQAEANREIGETALRLVYAVIEKVVPVQAQAHAIDSVEALVRDVLPLVYDEPTLVVRTHNMIADDVQARMEEVCSRSNFRGSISVAPDYELQPGDCRVDWQGGGADRNEGRLWADIRAIIEDNIGSVDVDALDTAADADASASAHETGTETETEAEAETETETEINVEAVDHVEKTLEHKDNDVTGDVTSDEPAPNIESVGDSMDNGPETNSDPETSDDNIQEPEHSGTEESMLNQDDDAEPIES